MVIVSGVLAVNDVLKVNLQWQKKVLQMMFLRATVISFRKIQKLIMEITKLDNFSFCYSLILTLTTIDTQRFRIFTLLTIFFFQKKLRYIFSNLESDKDRVTDETVAKELSDAEQFSVEVSFQ